MPIYQFEDCCQAMLFSGWNLFCVGLGNFLVWQEEGPCLVCLIPQDRHVRAQLLLHVHLMGYLGHCTVPPSAAWTLHLASHIRVAAIIISANSSGVIVGLSPFMSQDLRMVIPDSTSSAIISRSGGERDVIVACTALAVKSVHFLESPHTVSAAALSCSRKK